MVFDLNLIPVHENDFLFIRKFVTLICTYIQWAKKKESVEIFWVFHFFERLNKNSENKVTNTMKETYI